MKVPILVGPTSSGKTSLALKISAATGVHIISADSRQVYKFMDIGTGKLPLNFDQHSIEKNDGFWKIDGCTIWGYDVAEPDQPFNSYEFAYFALNKIRELNLQKIPVLVVGGTGFFTDTLSGRLNLEAAKADDMLRKELNSQSLETLLTQFELLSPQQFATIDKKNKVRVVRAIERLTLKTDEKIKLNREGLDFEYLGLNSSRQVLYARADLWAEKIWGEKFFDEVRLLIKKGFVVQAPLNGIIYKTALLHLNEQISFEDGLQRIKFDLHAYIRRQQTWFKKNLDIKWFDIGQDNDLVSIIVKSLYT